MKNDDQSDVDLIEVIFQWHQSIGIQFLTEKYSSEVGTEISILFDLLIDLTMSFLKTRLEKIVIINKGVVVWTEQIAFSSYKSIQYTQTSRQSLEICSFWLLPMHKGEIFQMPWKKIAVMLFFSLKHDVVQIKLISFARSNKLIDLTFFILSIRLNFSMLNTVYGRTILIINKTFKVSYV